MPSFPKVPIAVGLFLGLAACASQPPSPPPIYMSQASYCYISLADTECYRAPVSGQAYRRVGTRPTASR